jgi:FMN-dependent NADH-azoreductase
MKTILKIQASLFGAHGQSSQLADRFIEGLRSQYGQVRTVTRDLTAHPIPPLTIERFQAFGTASADRTAEQQTIVQHSDALIDELRAADVVVLAVPMYNFTVPAALHNYFDHIARAGVTFRYTEHGPEGLLKGKQVYVFVTRGGYHQGSEHSQTAFLREFLAFIGLDDAKFVYAEGLAISAEAREHGLDAANAELTTLLLPAKAVA